MGRHVHPAEAAASAMSSNPPTAAPSPGRPRPRTGTPAARAARVDVLQALTLAGGLTPFAQASGIKILRRENGGEVVYEGPARIVGVSTIPYYGYGLRMFPYAEERPDRMSLRISSMGPVDFARNVKGIWRGDYENPSNMFDFLVQDINIEMDPSTPFQVGGDLMDERSHARVRLSERPIRLVDFYAPPSGRVDG